MPYVEQLSDVINETPSPVLPSGDPLVEATALGYAIEGKKSIKVKGATKDGIKIPDSEVALFTLILEEGNRELYKDIAYDLEGPLVG